MVQGVGFELALTRHPEWFQLRLSIDGVDLVDMVRAVEQPFADAEGHPHLAGDYSGLPWPGPLVAAEVLRHYLGDPSAGSLYDGRTQPLGCRCGEPGCWPLVCRNEVTRDTVRWLDFEQQYRNGRRHPPGHPGLWRHDDLGPFCFDRGQYEVSLLGAVRAIDHRLPTDPFEVPPGV